MGVNQTVIITPNYKPHRKQILLHNAPVSYDDIWVILYGGARGSGKSAGALADAFLFAQAYPGAKICIIRERLDAVKQSFLDKLPSLFPQEVQGVKVYEYREKSSSWYPSRSIVFPNGSYITLQRVASYAEARDMQGWEFHFLIIDELTKQEERTFDYLLTMVRSAQVVNKYTGKAMKIPTKVVCGCNPGGIGHQWVKRRFIEPTVIRYDDNYTPIQTKDSVEVVIDPSGNKIRRYIRFIPASYKDNPFLNKSYVANLMNLPDHMKQMDMYGNWDVVAGRMFDLKEEQKVSPVHITQDLQQFEGHMEIFISIDWGYKPSFHSAHWHAVFPDNRVVTFKELYGQELIFEEFAQEVKDMSEGFYISATCLPHDMFRSGDRYRDDKGRIIGETKADVFETLGLNPISVESGKGKVQLRFDKIHSAMEIKNSDGIHKFRISTACPMLIEELENAVHDDIDPTKLASGCKDHALDDFGLFLVYYSDDIEPLGFENIIKDNRTRLQRILDEDEERLEAEEEDAYLVGVDNIWDL